MIESKHTGTPISEQQILTRISSAGLAHLGNLVQLNKVEVQPQLKITWDYKLLRLTYQDSYCCMRDKDDKSNER